MDENLGLFLFITCMALKGNTIDHLFFTFKLYHFQWSRFNSEQICNLLNVILLLLEM